MTYKRFIRSVAKSTGMQRADVHAAFRIVFDGLKRALEGGESVPVPMFGTFYPKFTNRRYWTSPSTGERRLLEGGKAKLRFRASRRFEKRLNLIFKEKLANAPEQA